MQAHDARAEEIAHITFAGLASFVGTLVGVVLLIGVFLTFDVFLARIDSSESARHAASEYRRGLALLASNAPAQAADLFVSALAIERQNIDYALALGEAQRREGKTAEAEETLKALLERAENDGAVNLAMARVLTGEGRVVEAKSYFHRAIYGRWGTDSLARRAEARYALIDLLATHGGGRDLLAELLPLEDVSQDSVVLRKQLGRWFLLAGSPIRAANMFREVLRRDARDPDAYAGLGESALAQGNFRTAYADFEEALALAPNDSAIMVRRALADTLLANDPTGRGLDSPERAARGAALVERMLIAFDACIRRSPSPSALSARTLVADSVLGRESPRIAADSLVTLAASLWSVYGTSCAPRDADSVLQRLSARLAQ